MSKAIAKKEVKFDLTVLDNFLENGGDFTVTAAAEDFISKWVQFKKMVEQADEQVRKILQEKMSVANTLKVEGAEVKVYRRYFGEKYEITDPRMAVDQGFAVEEVKVKADSKTIETFSKSNNGVLPECVKLKDRTESVVISGLKDNG